MIKVKQRVDILTRCSK